MRLIAKILKWLLIGLLGTVVLLVATWPFTSPILIDSKYERFAEVHPKSVEHYQSEIKGAQPQIACGGTAGQYNWGESARQYVSLNGIWDVEQGEMSDTPPANFSHTVAVLLCG